MDQRDPTSERPTLLAGKYTLEQEIGHGGMATVYRAIHGDGNQPVAVKLIRQEYAESVGPARFLQEIEVVRGLTHPHIVPVLDAGTHDGLPYYVMPLIRGETLRARLDRERQLPLDDALSITRDVADALAHAHTRNIIHRDIKPENILIENGRALVADFGIARAISREAQSRLTRTGLSVGTPGYMSPEQATADEHIDGRTDIYSLASVLYEMLSGELPHGGATAQVILARQLGDDVRSLTPLRSSVSPALDAVILRALARTPADRFSTVDEFRAALSHAHASPATRPVNRARRRRVAAAVLLVAVAGGAGQWLLTRDGSGGDGRLGIAVFPLRPLRAQDAHWSESLSDFLSTALDGVPGVRVPDPWALWRDLRPQRDAAAAAPDAVTAERLARRAGASRFVLGTVLETGGRLELSIRVYAVGARDPLAAITAAHSPDSIATLVQDVGSAVIAKLWGAARPPSVPNIERNSTRSADALKAYLVARDALRRGMIDSAHASITRAITIDTTFVLALLDASVISTWAQVMRGQALFGLRELLARAAASDDSLNERTRLRLRALQASVETEGPQAAEALEAVVRLDPTDIQAWSDLTFIRLAYGWQFGADIASAAEAADRALALDSLSIPGIVMRLEIAMAALDSTTITRQIARLRASDSTSVLARRYLTSSHLLYSPDATFRATLDTLSTLDGGDWLAALRTLRAHAPERVSPLLSRWYATSGPGAPRRFVARVSAVAALELGRFTDADSSIRAGAFRENDFDNALDRVIITSAVAGVIDSGVVQRAVARQTRFMPVAAARARFDKEPVWETAWTLAAWNAMHGDTAVARQWHAVIGTFPGGGFPREWRASLRADIEARLAARRGDRVEAQRLVSTALSLWTVHSSFATSTSPEAAMRFTLADLLVAAGAADSAAVLFGSLIPPRTYVGPYTVRSYYELGRIAESKSRRAEAARYYELTVRSWSNATGEVSSLRKLARDGLDRTTADARVR